MIHTDSQRDTLDALPEVESLLTLIRLAAMDGYNLKPVSTPTEWVEEAKKRVFLVYLAGRNAVATSAP